MQVLSSSITPLLYLSKGDTVRLFEAILTDSDDAPVNLTGATVVLRRKLDAEGTVAVDFPCELYNQTDYTGRVRVTWPENSNDVPGDYLSHFRATWGTRQDTYPKGNYDYFIIRIHEGI